MMHYIVTRNFYSDEYPHKEQRRHLTREYTIPSLRRQTAKNFTWVVAGRNGLTPADTQGIDTIWLDVDPPKKFDSTTYLMQELISLLAQDLDPSMKIITTRLDNDDVLVPDFVERIQAAARDTDKGVIDAGGLRVDTRTRKIYRDTAYQKVPSPFLSVVEEKAGKRCRLMTAYYDQHGLMHRHLPLTKLEFLGWVQLIHESNKVMARSPAEVDNRGHSLDYDYETFMNSLQRTTHPGISPPNEKP